MKRPGPLNRATPAAYTANPAYQTARRLPPPLVAIPFPMRSSMPGTEPGNDGANPRIHPESGTPPTRKLATPQGTPSSAGAAERARIIERDLEQVRGSQAAVRPPGFGDLEHLLLARQVI